MSLLKHSADRTLEFSGLYPTTHQDVFKTLDKNAYVELHGLLTAAACAPIMVEPRVWWLVWTRAHKTANKALFEAALALHNTLRRQLPTGRWLPPLYPKVEAMRAWCRGFSRLVHALEDWGADEATRQLLLPVEILADKVRLRPTMHMADVEQLLLKAVRNLPQRIYDIFCYNKPKRQYSQPGLADGELSEDMRIDLELALERTQEQSRQEELAANLRALRQRHPVPFAAAHALLTH